MKKTKKKLNAYVKYLIILGISALAGGIIGVSMAVMDVLGGIGAVGRGAGALIDMIRSSMFYVILALTVIAVIFGELCLWKFRCAAGDIEDAQDEEGDRIEYRLERIGCAGTIGITLLNVLAVLVIATGYSRDYIAGLVRGRSVLLIAAFLLFMVLTGYLGMWQTRYIKAIQRAYPDRGFPDISARRFHQEWLERCDEAEREVIYRSAYKTYIVMGRVVGGMTFIAMLGQLLWDTGIMAVIMTGCVWLMLTVVYTVSCTRLKGKKLND